MKKEAVVVALFEFPRLKEGQKPFQRVDIEVKRALKGNVKSPSHSNHRLETTISVER